MEMEYQKVERESRKPRIGITHGDFNGISYEIIMKTFSDTRMSEDYTPIVYGSSKIASYYRKTLNMPDFNFNIVKDAISASSKKVNLVNCFQEEVKIDIGKSTETAGQMAYLALEEAIRDLKSNHIDLLVTAPINKKNIQSHVFNFPGHTEYLAKQFNVPEVLMLMVSQRLKVGVVTGHIPLRDVPSNLNKDQILSKIKILHQSLIEDFAILRPKIAVLGLNPHAGDGGLLGNEEQEIIIPAIEKAKEENILAYGPYPADGFFGSDQLEMFDGILAMYHDQGLAPFKALAFEKGVNYTAGLPVVRTSPAHGTAYEIAGKDIASPDSFREAIFLALKIHSNRMMYRELNANPLAAASSGSNNERQAYNYRQEAKSGQ
jgi:4-hydroxythreonine-4-phosphate dehydrogenase